LSRAFGVLLVVAVAVVVVVVIIFKRPSEKLSFY